MNETEIEKAVIRLRRTAKWLDHLALALQQGELIPPLGIDRYDRDEE